MDDAFAPGVLWPMGSWGGVVEYGGGDRSMVVLFYNKAIHNPAKSKTAGRPIFEDKIYVRIHPPGERLNIVDTPAGDDHVKRFPVQWNQFVQKQDQIPEGTPIGMLYPEQPAIEATLRAAGVFTVEQCAELSAHAIDNIGMGAQHYVNAAANYLKVSKKGVNATEFRAAMEKMEQENKLLKQQLESVKSQMDEMVKERMAAGIGAQQLQTILAGTMGRPVHMPAQAFDAATAQINATHKTRELQDIGIPQPRPKRRARPEV